MTPVTRSAILLLAPCLALAAAPARAQSDQWLAGPSAQTGHGGLARVELADGRVFAAGMGEASEIYDPASNAWSKAAPCPGESRILALVHVLPGGGVLLAGGFTWSFQLSKTATFFKDSWLYDPTADSWSQVGDLPAYMQASVYGVTLSSGQVLANVSVESTSPTVTYPFTLSTRTVLFDPATNAWDYARDASGQITSLAEPHAWSKLIVVPGGKVVVAGGRVNVPGLQFPSATLEIFDPAAGTWSSLAMPAVASEPDDAPGQRGDPSSILLPNGKVLIAGGTYLHGGAVAVRKSAVLFDPASLTFSSAVQMNDYRASNGIALLRDGRVLLASGLDENMQYQASCEVYDPAAGAFLPAASLPALNGVGSSQTGTPTVDFKAVLMHSLSHAITLNTGDVFLFPDAKANTNSSDTSNIGAAYKGTFLYVPGSPGN
jgi:hypothetical protein